MARERPPTIRRLQPLTMQLSPVSLSSAVSAGPLSPRDANSTDPSRRYEVSKAQATVPTLLGPTSPTLAASRTTPPNTASRPSAAAVRTPPSSASRARKPMTEAQRQLLAFQREFMRNATRMTQPPPVGAASPGSPRLIPLGSPGPVTPLKLEEDEGAGGDYLAAGFRSSTTTTDNTPAGDYTQDPFVTGIMPVLSSGQE